MRKALALIMQSAPDLAVEGEMRGDAALSKRVLDRVFPDSALSTDTNLLMMPNLDAANIAYNFCVWRPVAGSLSVRSFSGPTSRPTSLRRPQPCAAFST